MASGKVGRPGHHHAPHRKSSHADPFASGPAVNAASGSSPPGAASFSEDLSVVTFRPEGIAS